MKALKIGLIVWACAMASGSSPAQNQASPEERTKRLEDALAALQTELAQLKAQQAQTTGSAANEAATKPAIGPENGSDLKPVPAWLAKLTFKGDFRYRHEWKDDESKVDDRNRQRIRARVGVYSALNDTLDVGFRVASGNNAAPTGDSEGSPTSTNQDLTNAFSSKNLWLDLAYVAYRPTAIEGLRVVAGKMTNPYYRPGGSNLMFDSDVNPEGLAATYHTHWGQDLAIFGNVGGYCVEERATEADTSLCGVQGGVTYSLPDSEDVFVTVGGGYYDYGATKGKPALGSSAANFYGNTSIDGVYAKDFNILQVVGELAVPIGGRPARFFGDFVTNTRARSAENTGFLLGTSLGHCKHVGSWSLTYNYRQLDADAVVGVLTEATFAGGGTHVKGHTLAFNYQLAPHVQLGAACYTGERTRASTTDHDVILADLTVTF